MSETALRHGGSHRSIWAGLKARHHTFLRSGAYFESTLPQLNEMIFDVGIKYGVHEYMPSKSFDIVCLYLRMFIPHSIKTQWRDRL